MDPNVLHNLSYGMYIVSANKGDLLNAQIVNTVFQVTSEPVTIGISINNKNLTHEYIKSGMRFSLSILDQMTTLSFIGKFGFKSGRDSDKFKGTNFIRLASGCPVVLDNALCYIEAKVVKELDCFTHTLFIGEMTDSKMLKAGRPMTYDYYHQEKRGTTPSNAPTFIKGEMPVAKKSVKQSQGEHPMSKTEEKIACQPCAISAQGSSAGKEAAMQKYKCTVCNYIYDPASGDPDGGIMPGTPFEKIPNDWVCPVCGADKSQFVKEG